MAPRMRLGGPERFGRHRYFGNSGGHRAGRGDVHAVTLRWVQSLPDVDTASVEANALTPTRFQWAHI